VAKVRVKLITSSYICSHCMLVTNSFPDWGRLEFRYSDYSESGGLGVDLGFGCKQIRIVLDLDIELMDVC